MRKKATSQDCLFHTDSGCFMASRHLISLCSSYTTFIFFPPLSFEAQRVSPHSYIKRQKSRLQPSGLPNWTASHFSFMPLYADQGSGTKLFSFSLFLLPDNIKAICFVLRNVRSTGEIAKALAQLRCHWAAPSTDRGGEEAAAASCGERGKSGGKNRGEKEDEAKGDEEQTEAWSCKGNEKKPEQEGREVRGRDGMDWWMETMRQIVPPAQSMAN